jgi:hypothetical protein
MQAAEDCIAVYSEMVVDKTRFDSEIITVPK